MASKKKPARRYSDEDRANALAALAANAGNVSHTARQLGIPAKTLSQWAKGARHPEAVQMSEGKKGPLADRLEEVAWRIAAAIPDRLDSAPLQQLAVALGIVVDKMRLLRNEPTNISKTEGPGPDDLRTLTDAQLDERLAAARSRAAAPGPGAGKG